MSAILLTPPASEPLSLAEAKAWLRVEHDDDDDVITALIAAARLHVEALTRRALITQSWRLVLDGWPVTGRIDMTPAPLRTLNAARVYDAGGVTHSVDTQAFVVDPAGAALSFAPWSVAQPGRVAAGIELDVTAGYGDAEDVPEPLRQAIRLLLAHWYENRGLVTSGPNVAALPATAAALLAPYRAVSL
ncbi:MAG: phage head-tail connector protein [Pseudolabrys sp.]|nr:phage head-tail connector protein [Pseudolabrys sp.]